MNDMESIRTLAARAIAKEKDWLLRNVWTEGFVAVFAKSDEKGRAEILDALKVGKDLPTCPTCGHFVACAVEGGAEAK